MSSLLGGASVKILAGRCSPPGTGTAAGAAPSAGPPPGDGAATAAATRIGQRPLLRVVTADAARGEAELTFDGAALSYLPDKFVTVGGLTDAQRGGVREEPFVINDTRRSGRTASSCSRSAATSWRPGGRPRAARPRPGTGRAARRPVRLLTGLIPSMTNYGVDLAAWARDRPGCPGLTTGTRPRRGRRPQPRAAARAAGRQLERRR